MSSSWQKGIALGCAMLLMTALSARVHAQSKETVTDATFKKQTGQIVVFYVKKQGKVRLVKGRLSEGTSIIDESGREMSSDADLSGVWDLELTEAVGEVKIGDIVEMRRSR